MKLSVVIPAHNEEGCIEPTVRALYSELMRENISHEILVINDHSKDRTGEILDSLEREYKTLRHMDNHRAGGFGLAIRLGLENFTGDCVAIYMADASDDPKDLVKFYRTMVQQKVDCVFGSRFSKGGRTYDYPWFKLILNRLANKFIQVVFGIAYNDTTNAFKLYHRRAIEGARPFLSHHFNLTVELPLKALIRGSRYEVVPNSWTNRKAGESKLKIKEMGSRYLFIVIYCFIERWLSRGDYARDKVINNESPNRDMLTSS